MKQIYSYLKNSILLTSAGCMIICRVFQVSLLVGIIFAGQISMALGDELLEEYVQQKGVWLRSPVAEAFIIAQPYPRLLVFRTIGGESPLLIAPHEFIGIRTWFLEPVENEHSPLPARQPGKFIKLKSQYVYIETSVDPVTHLQAILEVKIDSEHPVLQVSHGLRNTAKISRTLSVWSIAAFNRTGRLIVPWGTEDRPIRSLVLFKETNIAEPCLRYGIRALTLDLTLPVSTGQMKVGVRSESGWAAYVRDTSALIIESPYMPTGIYPEGGANITCYHNGKDEGHGWAEIEHVSPLVSVAPGECAWLKESYEFRTISVPGEDTPDTWLAAIEKVRRP